jgi:hypothetical protein
MEVVCEEKKTVIFVWFLYLNSGSLQEKPAMVARKKDSNICCMVFIFKQW